LYSTPLKACGLTAPVTPTGRRPLDGAGYPTPLYGVSQTPLGLRRGHRAPPRGVDVKATPARPREGAPPPLEGPGKAPGGLRGPGFPIWGSQGPGTRSRPRARGGFYINPSRRGPVPGPGLAGSPSGVPGSFWPLWGLPAQIPQNRGFWPKSPILGLSRLTPAKGRKPGYRAPARGVDVKPPSRGLPESGKSGEKGLKWPKRPFFGVLAHFREKWGFWGISGPLGPSPVPRFRGGFTSTPRGGALPPAPGPGRGSPEGAG